MANLLWLKGGACSGNTMSFLNAEEPSVIELVMDFGIHILYHPSIGLEIGEQIKEVLDDALSGRVPVDILVFEGSVIQGPDGSGIMNLYAGRPMKDWIKDLAEVAQYVVAIGDCAAWGGIVAVPPNPTESTGMQFHKRQKGGFLGTGFISKAGLPVINIPGCPAHPDWMTQILVALATGRMGEVLLDELQRPRTFFTDFVQTGCTNARSFAEKIPGGFGKRANGCLFYEVGCRGPLTRASCNRILWNRVSSKTRANHPCLGCTEPGFPHHDLKICQQTAVPGSGETLCRLCRDVLPARCYRQRPAGRDLCFIWRAMATKNKFRQVLFHIETVPIAVYCEARSTITNYKFACHSCGQPSSNVVSGTELLIHRVHFA